MLVRILYLMLLAILLRLLYRALAERVTISFQRGGSGKRDALYKGAMVKDPVCGVHLPQSRALVETRSGDRVYFCSDRCREAFRKAEA